MGLIIVPIAMSIQIIFLFKRDVLLDVIWKRRIWASSILLFLLGYLLSKMLENNQFLPFLMMPLQSYILYLIFHAAFLKLFKTKPVDTFHTYDLKLMKSGIFNFIFWVLGMLLPILIIFKVIL